MAGRETLQILSVHLSVVINQKTIGKRYVDVCLWLWHPHIFCFQELRNAQSEQLMGIRREEEMEMSDDENCDSPTKKMRVDESGNSGNCHAHTCEAS